LKTLFEARLNTSLFLISFVPHVAMLVVIYLRANVEGLASLNLPITAPLRFIEVNEDFFLGLLGVQMFLSFVLAAVMGPGLVSPDLTNNAMPLYLSRPLSRAEYVLGKLSVLLTVTSLVTWVPGLLLIAVQTSLAGPSWLWDHPRVVIGFVLSSWIWILTVSLIALALSAWVRWKPVAVAGLFAVFFLTGGFGTASNLLLDMKWGTLLNISTDMGMVSAWLFLGQDVFRVPLRAPEVVPAWTGLLALILICASALFLLSRKVRAVHAVR
jgi:ABC-2 type transport system permease protein